MNRRRFRAVWATIPLLILALGCASAPGPAPQAAPYPRIQASIAALQETIAYLEQAPDNFGGHKASALESCRSALQELRAALAYRATQDNH
jgi:hypothetical protein